MMQYWVPLIKDGVACGVKPEPLISGQDHWPDWDRLVKQARKKLADARRNNSGSRQRVSEFSIRKNAVAFVVGGDHSAAKAEITKIISHHRQSRWYEEGPLKGPWGHSRFNSP
jgi:hypothetical protein